MKTWKLSTGLCLLALAVGSPKANADDIHFVSHDHGIVFGARTHIDDLAADLMRSANRAAWDMYANYADNPGYRDVYRDMFDALQETKHIYGLVYDEQYHRRRVDGGVDHIAADLQNLERLYVSILERTATWTPTFYNPYHDQGFLPLKLKALGENINHLMADYGVRSTLKAAVAVDRVVTTEPPAPQAEIAQPAGPTLRLDGPPAP